MKKDYEIYDEESGVTLDIPANSLDEAIALSETKFWADKFNEGEQ